MSDNLQESAQQTLDGKPMEAMLAVQAWIADTGAKLDPTALTVELDEEGLSLEQAAIFVWMRNPHIAQPMIRGAFDLLTFEQARLDRAAIRARFKQAEEDASPYTGRAEALQELEKFLALLVPADIEPERLTYYRAAMRQLIWQVKRRLAGERSWWEIMVVFVGPQGGGKSTAVEAFGAPLGRFFLRDATFDLFTDKFRMKTLATSYLVRLDEMEHAKRADMQCIKRVITSDFLQGRKIYSASEVKVKRNASFVGTSNRSLVDDISDETGMRRFVEIQCAPVKWTREWQDRLEAINFDKLWTVESAKDPDAPYNKQPELFAKYQVELVTRSDFETWAEEFLMIDKGGIGVGAGTLYASYVEFQSRQKRKPMGIQAFSRKVSELYPTSGRILHGRRIFDCLAIRADPSC